MERRRRWPGSSYQQQEGREHGNRHRQVVQRCEGLWLHHARRRQRGFVRAFLGDQHVGLQDPEGRPEGELRRRAGAQGQTGLEYPEGLKGIVPDLKGPPSGYEGGLFYWKLYCRRRPRLSTLLVGWKILQPAAQSGIAGLNTVGVESDCLNR